MGSKKTVKIKHNEGQYEIGKSDCVDTYCCESRPSWWVEFPNGYNGYYSKYDCEVLD